MGIVSRTDRDPGGLSLLDNTPLYDATREAPLGGLSKRSLDFAIALSALLLLSPLFVLIAVLIKLCDGGPVFYGHTRIGYNSRSFRCWKFRTMVADADTALWDHLRQCPEATREWLQAQKLKNDPRLTAVGGVLRQLSIDELPQLINILRGEMSIVGPRPVVIDELQKYGQDVLFYFRARPGLTGAWQVGGRSDVSYERRVFLDRHYVENWSLCADMIIIVKTIPAVLFAKGSY